MNANGQYRVFKDRKIVGQLLITTWGFLLTGIIGTGLTFLFSRLDWKARTKFEEASTMAAGRRDEIKVIVNLCQRRYFYSERLYQLLEAQQADEIEDAYATYKKIIDEWNLNLYVNHLMIEKAIGPEAAELYCDHQIMSLSGDVSGSSVHTRFFFAAKELRKGYIAWKAGKSFKNAPEALAKLRDTSKSLQVLYDYLLSKY